MSVKVTLQMPSGERRVVIADNLAEAVRFGGTWIKAESCEKEKSKDAPQTGS